MGRMNMEDPVQIDSGRVFTFAAEPTPGALAYGQNFVTASSQSWSTKSTNG